MNINNCNHLIKLNSNNIAQDCHVCVCAFLQSRQDRINLMNFLPSCTGAMNMKWRVLNKKQQTEGLRVNLFNSRRHHFFILNAYQNNCAYKQTVAKRETKEKNHNKKQFYFYFHPEISLILYLLLANSITLFLARDAEGDRFIYYIIEGNKIVYIYTIK